MRSFSSSFFFFFFFFFFATDVVKLGVVGCMFHGHVELLALVTPLGWGDQGKVLFPEEPGCAYALPPVAPLLAHESLNPLKLLQRRFPDINAVSGHPERLIWFEPRKHRKEVDQGVGQHVCPQMGVLGLGPIIVYEDVTQRAPLGALTKVPL